MKNSGTKALVKSERETVAEERSYRPRVDIVEDGKALTLYADLSGVSADSLSVHLEKGVLTVHGDVAERQPEATKYLLREYGVGNYHREFQVGEEIDAERIQAELRDGVLIVKIEKLAPDPPKRIDVKSN